MLELRFSLLFVEKNVLSDWYSVLFCLKALIHAVEHRMISVDNFFVFFFF